MSRPQQPQQHDTSLGPLWILIGLFVLGAVIWYFGQAEIVWFIFKLKLIEISGIALFTNELNHLAGVMRDLPPSQYANISASQLMEICTTVGNYLRYPVAAVLGVFALVMYFGNPVLRFKKTYSMQRLVDEEKADWPQINPVVNLDLVKENVDEGPWAMGLTPLQFSKKHNLLREERIIAMGNAAVMRPRVLASVLRGEATRLFALQLGPYWEGPLALPIHMQALFAVFAARVAGDRDSAFKLLNQINVSTAKGHLDFSGVRELLVKHMNNKYVQRVTQRHAFVYTVMASLLVLARDDGVLASADFLWMKPVDRSFWLMMSSVGRQTPFTEVAGPFAHWLTEQRFGRPLRVPVVEQAVNALEAAISDVVYKPESEE